MVHDRKALIAKNPAAEDYGSEVKISGDNRKRLRAAFYAEKVVPQYRGLNASACLVICMAIAYNRSDRYLRDICHNELLDVDRWQLASLQEH